MNWPKLIRQLEKSGLTQQQIAEQCGTSQPYISQLRSRKRRCPGFDIGKKLESLLESRERVAA